MFLNPLMKMNLYAHSLLTSNMFRHFLPQTMAGGLVHDDACINVLSAGILHREISLCRRTEDHSFSIFPFFFCGFLEDFFLFFTM